MWSFKSATQSTGRDFPPFLNRECLKMLMSPIVENCRGRILCFSKGGQNLKLNSRCRRHQYLLLLLLLLFWCWSECASNAYMIPVCDLYLNIYIFFFLDKEEKKTKHFVLLTKQIQQTNCVHNRQASFCHFCVFMCYVLHVRLWFVFRFAPTSQREWRSAELYSCMQIKTRKFEQDR